MANQYVNKVIYGSDTLVDLTGDTAEAGDVLLGKSFHLKSGLQSSGTLDPALKPDIAPVEASVTTSQAYTVGDYLYYDSVLYMVTSAIAQGGTIITSGTGQNVTDVTVGSRLKTLYSDLADKQPKTLATAQTIGGTSRTTVEAALGALADSNYLEDSLTSSSAVKALTAKQGKALADKHKVSSFEVAITGWTSDTSSQSGTTLYKKSISLSHVYVSSPSVDIGTSSGTGLPTAAQQTDYNLLQYVTVDDTVPCLYLYASAIPSAMFYIKVEGVD